MALLLAIDPGNVYTAYCIIDIDTFEIVDKAKILNIELYPKVLNDELKYDKVAIEMMASMNMAVGKTVFDTILWIGRYFEMTHQKGYDPVLVYRSQEKMNLLGKARGKDSDIIAALVERFTPGQPNYGKGTKANPGWFFGMSADMWQAYAVGVTAIDLNKWREK